MLELLSIIYGIVKISIKIFVNISNSIRRNSTHANVSQVTELLNMPKLIEFYVHVYVYWLMCVSVCELPCVLLQYPLLSQWLNPTDSLSRSPLAICMDCNKATESFCFEICICCHIFEETNSCCATLYKRDKISNWIRRKQIATR